MISDIKELSQDTTDFFNEAALSYNKLLAKVAELIKENERLKNSLLSSDKALEESIITQYKLLEERDSCYRIVQHLTEEVEGISERV